MTEPRLHLDHTLAADITVPLVAAQAHYLRNVMRLTVGKVVRVFNGRDGEWRAMIATIGRSGLVLVVQELIRLQQGEPGPTVLFAPVRKERLHMLVEKATELGAARLQPVITARTDKARVQIDRLVQHAIEAAEQCERLTVPEVPPPCALSTVLADWPEHRPLLLLDESGGGLPVDDAIRIVRDRSIAMQGSAPLPGILAGPEGGFTATEANDVRLRPFAVPVSLGPRILRAETAVIAALACWQAFAGDWRTVSPPHRGT